MNTSRRDFLFQAGKLAGGVALSGGLSSFLLPEETEKFHFKISLAQWSLHKALFREEMTTLDFPEVARKQYDIHAIEYVSQFFQDKAKDQSYLKTLKERCRDNGVKSLLIMVDLEGSLASPNPAERKKAVENHYKWVEAARFLGCHAIRVNLHGENRNEHVWRQASIDGLGKLAEFCADRKIHALVENHGQFSSNGKLLAEVVSQIKNPYCGTLPDFGNFCLRREKGDMWESPCVDWYDPYKGVEEMLPFAKGVSAKSFDFDDNGDELHTDFRRMLRLIQQSGYKGYVGIEYEGENLPEKQGILQTKALLEKIRREL